MKMKARLLVEIVESSSFPAHERRERIELWSTWNMCIRWVSMVKFIYFTLSHSCQNWEWFELNFSAEGVEQETTRERPANTYEFGGVRVSMTGDKHICGACSKVFKGERGRPNVMMHIQKYHHLSKSVDTDKWWKTNKTLNLFGIPLFFLQNLPSLYGNASQKSNLESICTRISSLSPIRMESSSVVYVLGFLPQKRDLVLLT